MDTAEEFAGRRAVRAALVGLALVCAPANAGLQVAQYVADPSQTPGYQAALANPYDPLPAADPRGLPDDRRMPANLLDPLGLSGYGVTGRIARPSGAGAAGGTLDYELHFGTLAADPESRSHVLRIGPRLSLLPDSTTHLYYSYRSDTYGEPGNGGIEGAEQMGAGVAQTVPLGERDALLRLEYGVETLRAPNGSGPAVDRGALNLSGALPLPWGLTANFEADYGFESQTVAGWRSAFRAGLSGWLAENLRANISLSYAQEEDTPDALQRRRAFGLNVHYAY